MRFTYFFLLISILVYSQDGSNIKYYSVKEMDSNVIGRICHIDFGANSFSMKSIDTVQINVNGKMLNFHELRTDNGYSNWFDSQYLLYRVNKSEIRLTNSRIDSISENRIFVTSILSYYINNIPIDSITVFQHQVKKQDISGILVKHVNRQTN